MPADARLILHAARYGDRFVNDTNWAMVERLEAFCAQRGRSLLELAFGWLAAQPRVSSVIAGATRPEQVEQNVLAVEWIPTPEELRGVDALTKPAVP
jgi:aryl-alcohol dehydrogenase-like predicted oxidoreductase